MGHAFANRPNFLPARAGKDLSVGEGWDARPARRSWGSHGAANPLPNRLEGLRPVWEIEPPPRPSHDHTAEPPLRPEGGFVVGRDPLLGGSDPNLVPLEPLRPVHGGEHGRARGGLRAPQAPQESEAPLQASAAGGEERLRAANARCRALLRHVLLHPGRGGRLLRGRGIQSRLDPPAPPVGADGLREPPPVSCDEARGLLHDLAPRAVVDSQRHATRAKRLGEAFLLSWPSARRQP
jgi:hypothetical protein